MFQHKSRGGCAGCAPLSLIPKVQLRAVPLVETQSFSPNVSITNQQPCVFVQGIRESAAGEAPGITRDGSATAAASSGWRGGCGVLRGQHCRVLRGHSASVGRNDQVSSLDEASLLVRSHFRSALRDVHPSDMDKT